MIEINHLWGKVREANPLVHTISNLVSANDCANLLLAVGASPIMASAIQEMEDITRISQATVLNLGTPNDSKYATCTKAGVYANKYAHPVIVDPVGIGASLYRKEKVTQLLKEVQPTIIRANIGEVQSLLGSKSQARGVDSFAQSHSDDGRSDAVALAQKLDCVVLMTGKDDFVTNGTQSYLIEGGSSILTKITGTGDMLSILCGALSNVTDSLIAALGASYSWKVIGKLVKENSTGLGQAHRQLFDYASQIEQITKIQHTVTIHDLGGRKHDN